MAAPQICEPTPTMAPHALRNSSGG